MKKSIGLLIFILLLTKAYVHAEQVVYVKFSRDDKTFISTTRLAEDLEKEFKFKPKSPKVLLIETPSLKNEDYKKQTVYLHGFGKQAQKYELLYVIACPEKTYGHGYHTSVEDAKGLSTDGEAVFRVRLLNSKGLLLNQSTQPVASDELKKWLDSIK